MPHPGLTTEEIGRRGQDLYDRQRRARVEADHRGRYLVLDVETGDYEIGDDYLVLSRRLQARRPDAALYTVRIGYPAVGRIGARASVGPK
jgi:NADPH-dependent 2,4-dienoyl-CoA reductase/sulfur reductase-like enzyme